MSELAENIENIIRLNLTKGRIPTACNSNTNIISYHIGSTDMYVANIICGAFDIKDPKIVSDLGLFIAKSWKDQELCNEQVTEIIEYFKSLLISHMNRPFFE